MIEIKKDFTIDSFDLNGAEAKLDTVQDLLNWYKIEELKISNNLRRFQFSIDDDSNKILTVNDIKRIFIDKYWYDKDAISLKKDSVSFDSWICKAGDIIYVYIDSVKDLKIKELKKNTTTEKENAENLESPYKEMIERQTGPIDSDPTKTEIAISIDDWYNRNWNLEKMLDVLDKKWIKATFFTLWEVISWDKNEIWEKEVLGRWHQICCHTFSHAYIENSEITNLFYWHGISAKNRKRLVRQWEWYIKEILWWAEYDKIKELSWPDFPRKVNTTALLDAEIRMWEIQIEKSFWIDYLLKMKRDFPFYRFPWKVWANRPENIQVLKDHGYLSIWWTHESGKDNSTQTEWWIELFHVNDSVANNFEKYLDELWIQGTQVTNIVTPK